MTVQHDQWMPHILQSLQFVIEIVAGLCCPQHPFPLLCRPLSSAPDRCAQDFCSLMRVEKRKWSSYWPLCGHFESSFLSDCVVSDGDNKLFRPTWEHSSRRGEGNTQVWSLSLPVHVGEKNWWGGLWRGQRVVEGLHFTWLCIIHSTNLKGGGELWRAFLEEEKKIQTSAAPSVNLVNSLSITDLTLQEEEDIYGC